MNRLFTFLVLLSLGLRIAAQSPKNRVISIPVIRNGLQMRDPWLGGFDSPQFSNCDLNQDGIPDLFVFDRVGNKVYTYLGNGGSTDTMFTYAPQYEHFFPADLNNWALIRDYNHDGIPDIFAHTGLGTVVYKGSRQNGFLHFDVVSKYLKYTSNSFTPNLYTIISDMPAITDVNGDGDIDILTYDEFGSAIAYYENLTVENTGNPAYAYDSLKYALVTTCWGKVEQNLLTNSITLNIDTAASCQYGSHIVSPLGGSPGSRHAGNSLFTVKDPVYNTVDILNGNVGYNDLFFLRNDGQNDLNGNVYEWDSIFPRCGHAMLMASYPAAYGINISSDSLQDILMSPNGYAPYAAATFPARNVKNVLHYQNTGDTVCWYQYQSDSFLVHHMLDFGTNSKPVFYDFNGDGLLDIVVGSYGYFDSLLNPEYRSSIAYYQNTGTASHPQFTEITTDLDNLSQFHLPGIFPAFGDLNGDGRPDMLIGDANGSLYYFQNGGTGGVSSFPSMTSASFFNIGTAQFAAPFIYDLNGDGLPDLILGRMDGGLSYYWNFGTPQVPEFSIDSVNPNLGNINVTPIGQAYGFSQPFVYKDNSGTLKLLVGAQNGEVYEYNIDPARLRSANDTFAVIDSDFIGQSVGQNATISVADINGDGLNEYLMGTATGGIMMYSDSIWDPGTILGNNDIVPNKRQLSIYPNPAKDYFICSFDNVTFANPKTEVYDLLGQQLFPDVSLNSGKVIVNSDALCNGFYMIRITDAGKTYTGKVILNK